MEYVAALFLASAMSCLKTTFTMKMYGIWCFSFFLRRFGKFLHFSQKFQFFSNTTLPIFKKMVKIENRLLCQHILKKMVKIENRLLCQHILESFTWPICFEFFLFSQKLNAQF